MAQARGALSAQLTGMDELGQRTYALGFLSEYLADNWWAGLVGGLGRFMWGFAMQLCTCPCPYML